MLFSTQEYLLLFLPLVLIAFYSCVHVRILRQLVLIGASLLFYGLWNWHFVPFLILLTFVNWFIACQYSKHLQKHWLTFGIILNLLTLGFFKYTNFFAGTVEDILGIQQTHWAIVMPLGISFFVFQKISYLVDLKRGAKSIYNIIDFFEFVTFFPQLISGPIVRHNEIIPQFQTDPVNPQLWENISKGLCLMSIGLIKKAGIADSLGMTCNPLFNQALQGQTLNMAQGWAAAISYSLQIFFDFSGYSDMAIGAALLFGLKLPFNFNAPYQSHNLQEFWRRWHMTLSRFLRDYLYIPLGGNRCGPIRQSSNLIITMLLAGLWHGAGWTFVVWGGLHGLGLSINHIWNRTIPFTLPRPVAWCITLIFLIFSWVLFRAENFSTATEIWQSMLGFNGIGNYKIRHNIVFYTAILLVLFCPSSQNLIYTYLRPSKWIAILGGIAAAFFILLIGGRIPDAFIYFRF
ncbi:MBOAT family O-acyltransferase [Commensalibacter oyaizuii]|uniref:Probable alginate O-acetylase AlgI n=1 Tax=Commensalibacter oyaizuii TaxID=3043873 RepID=A0ABT6Q303_9PROT|nr:MBOAT family O-acyltransferase [Commensalibacter sp. TBRC 16381]MDI2091368.1 MBOAT family O-acyltransferase [Commensalibacter sp. TBRC 16381]